MAKHVTRKKKKAKVSQLQKGQEAKLEFAAQTQFSGPIPPPESLAAYGKLDSELINRIVSMAENEARNRQSLEQQSMVANVHVANSQVRERKRGQWLGFSIAVLGLGCSFGMAFIGSEVAASLVGGTTVIGLVGVFVTGQYLQRKDNS